MDGSKCSAFEPDASGNPGSLLHPDDLIQCPGVECTNSAILENGKRKVFFLDLLLVTEARRGSEKKQGQDEPIKKWLVWQGLIGWETNLG